MFRFLTLSGSVGTITYTKGLAMTLDVSHNSFLALFWSVLRGSSAQSKVAFAQASRHKTVSTIGESEQQILNFSVVRTKSRTRFRRYARRGVRGRQHQSDRQCCRHIGDGRNDSVTSFGHRMHQLVAVSPDMLFGQFFANVIVTMQK